MHDNDFSPTRSDLDAALDLQLKPRQIQPTEAVALPETLPDTGIGSHAALRQLAPQVLARARDLGAPLSFAHMDPPTPWVSWVVTQWAASVNQNLLHPDTAPAAIGIERKVVDWLCPYFGMDGGHMTPGSTLANLTALWAARECRNITRIVASEACHLSIKKAANLLGLAFYPVAMDKVGRLRIEQLPDDLTQSCLVLTAGTTNTGTIDPLTENNNAAWVHIDAAWAGPLVFSERFASRLAGIERADSVAVSAHKWLFQPKESALILFRDTAAAQRAITFGGPYLAAPNVGVLGSHGASAAPLLATLLAWGRQGVAERIERCMANADALAVYIAQTPELNLYARPETGVIAWRTRDEQRMDTVWASLAPGSTSQTLIDGARWFRNVAANPNADVSALIADIDQIVS